MKIRISTIKSDDFPAMFICQKKTLFGWRLIKMKKRHDLDLFGQSYTYSETVPAIFYKPEDAGTFIREYIEKKKPNKVVFYR